MTAKLAAATVAVAEASEAMEAEVQTRKAKKVATEVMAEMQVATLLDQLPRAVFDSARGTSAEQGVGQVVDDSQQPDRRRFQSQSVCICLGSY